MRSQIAVLETLQQLDLELGELEDNLEKYPQEISRYEEELKRIKESISKTKEELNAGKKRKMEKELNLAENKEKIKRVEARLFEIKTYKEYEALQREVAEAKKLTAEIEEGILKEMETVEDLEALLKEKENELAEKEKEYEQIINNYNRKINELKNIYETKKQEKKRVTSIVNPEILSMYERIRMRNGFALAAARNEICTGCNMNIPPQLFNEVLMNSRMIQCPNCHRILYCEETVENGVQTA
jgi:predicted  nucleic acid-binding Zn-ribbon protein